MKDPPPSRPPRKPGKATGFRSARQFPWTKEEDALLGKFEDKELEPRLQRSAASIKARRRQLGIPALNGKPQPLKPDVMVLLATKSDREFRSILGWSVRKIHDQRHSLARRRVRQSHQWSIAEDRLLGIKSDRVLAKMFGRSASAVKQRRHLKRIWLVRRKWQPADDRLLGTRSDEEIARLLGRKTWQVTWRRRKLGIRNHYRKRPWAAQELALVGVRPDEEVARLTSHTLKAVVRKRHLLGKPKSNPVLDRGPGRTPGRHARRRSG